MIDQDDGKYEEKGDGDYGKITKKNNILPMWGNERTMNLNPLILTNIQSSHYFKVNLYELKTYHEVIDEIYYKVSHLEPWEKGSRKTAGQTGMCGGVRGVGAGGIVSTAFCLLYKLFTLKLSRKQVIGLITHPDSPYIRALGFMYIRYTQPPADLWDWYEPYLEDPEEMDVKAGGGQVMTIGNILKNFLCKLEWFSTLFPRIPVPIQQKLEKKMTERFPPFAQVAKPPIRAAGSTTEVQCSDKRGSRSLSKGKSTEYEDDRDARRDRQEQCSDSASTRRSSRDRTEGRNAYSSASRERDGKVKRSLTPEDRRRRFSQERRKDRSVDRGESRGSQNGKYVKSDDTRDCRRSDSRRRSTERDDGHRSKDKYEHRSHKDKYEHKSHHSGSKSSGHSYERSVRSGNYEDAEEKRRHSSRHSHAQRSYSKERKRRSDESHTRSSEYKEGKKSRNY